MKRRLIIGVVVLAALGAVWMLVRPGDREMLAPGAPPAAEEARLQRGVAGDAIQLASHEPPARARGKIRTEEADFAGFDYSPSGSPAGGSPADGTVDLTAMAAAQPDRYLIKNATVSVQVEDAREACDALMEAVAKVSGYVGNLRESVNALGQRNVSLQIRVPAGEFDNTMLSLDALGKVLDRQVTTQDVTEEFVDTEAKLRNLKATEERVLDHLNRTGKLEDILAVERELSRYRAEIERMEGRVRFLKNRVAFSTISVSMTEPPKKQPVMPPEGFSSSAVASEATRSLVKFGQRVWTRIIWIGVWAPVWGGLTLVALLLGWLARRTMKRLANNRTGTES